MSENEINITRRGLLGGFVAGALFGVTASILRTVPEYPECPPGLVFAKFHGLSSSASDVAKEFVRANSAQLMAYYAVFFPRFIEYWRYKAPDIIKDAAEKEKKFYPNDHHRLNALPAVVATHVLPIAADSKQREKLCGYVAAALNSSNREIREIVLQNVMSATAPHFDSVRFLILDKQILEAIDRIIVDSENDENLISPLCLAVDLLMNYKALVRSRLEASILLPPVDARLARISSSKCGHLTYAQRLMAVHPAGSGSVDVSNAASLPPQRSEALIGYNRLEEYYPLRQWLGESALIHARNVFNVYRVASGQQPQSPSMSVAEATRALPKGLAFLKYHLPDYAVPEGADAWNLSLPREEKSFKRFLAGDLSDLLKTVDLTEHIPSNDERQLSQCVPFGRYTSRSISSRLAHNNDVGRREFFFNLVCSSGESLFSGGAAGAGLYSLWKSAFGTQRTSIEDTEETLPDNFSQDVHDSIEDADGELGASLDEQEDELGPPRP